MYKNSTRRSFEQSIVYVTWQIYLVSLAYSVSPTPKINAYLSNVLYESQQATQKIDVCIYIQGHQIEPCFCLDRTKNFRENTSEKFSSGLDWFAVFENKRRT